MKQIQFVNSNHEGWTQFEKLCAQSPDTSLPVDFPEQYRKLCNDLAIARTRQYSPVLVEQLNNMVLSGQKKLYQVRTNQFKEIINITRTAFPVALYQNRLMLLVNILAFLLVSLGAFIWVLVSPDSVYVFIDSETILDIELMYDPLAHVQTSVRTAAEDVMMFGVYIYNNISIAFQMFAGGSLFCVGAVYFLLFNGFYFGAISGHIINMGLEETFFSFVITHGAFELTAIVIASAAGCQIGYSLLKPGQYTRPYAIKQAAKKVIPLIIGAFVMLVIAAFIEAFWSPRDFAPQIKYITGSLCWAYVIYRLYKGMRYGA